MKVYVIDLDGTLCHTPYKDGKPQYYESTPKTNRIAKINSLYEEGNYIIIETARGKASGKNWFTFTQKQLDEWGLKYHRLRTNTKFVADYYIDDKAIHDREFFNDERV